MIAFAQRYPTRMPSTSSCVYRTVFERLQPVIAIFSANPFLRYCVSLFAFFESMEKES